jgi:hypothetical protein
MVGDGKVPVDLLPTGPARVLADRLRPMKSRMAPELIAAALGSLASGGAIRLEVQTRRLLGVITLRDVTARFLRRAVPWYGIEGELLDVVEQRSFGPIRPLVGEWFGAEEDSPDIQVPWRVLEHILAETGLLLVREQDAGRASIARSLLWSTRLAIVPDVERLRSEHQAVARGAQAALKFKEAMPELAAALVAECRRGLKDREPSGVG